MKAALWPYGKCEKCANKNYCAWSESEILNCMNNGYQNFSPMRNADRIRAMTDEELMKFVADDICELVCGAPASCDWRCEEKLLDWLKEEVRE